MPPIDQLTKFDPSKVKKELSEVENNHDKTKLSNKIPALKKFLLAKLEPEKFFPVNNSESDDDWTEVSSYTSGVKDWYAAHEKRK